MMPYILLIATDMGNGCRLCSECGFDLDNGDIFKKIPNICLGCKVEFGSNLNVKELLKYEI